MTKTKCELCKTLNLIAEGKKHPSQTIWQAINIKVNKLQAKDAGSIASLCENHRTPLIFVTDCQSVLGFIKEVTKTVEDYVMNPRKFEEALLRMR